MSGYKDCDVEVVCRRGHVATWTCFNLPTNEKLRLSEIQKRSFPCSSCFAEFAEHGDGYEYEKDHTFQLLTIDGCEIHNL